VTSVILSFTGDQRSQEAGQSSGPGRADEPEQKQGVPKVKSPSESQQVTPADAVEGWCANAAAMNGQYQTTPLPNRPNLASGEFASLSKTNPGRLAIGPLQVLKEIGKNREFSPKKVKDRAL
jgi:hypothetical protein